MIGINLLFRSEYFSLPFMSKRELTKTRLAKAIMAFEPNQLIDTYYQIDKKKILDFLSRNSVFLSDRSTESSISF